MNKLVLNIFTGILALLIFSCKDQYDFSTDNLSDDIPVNPEIAIPLVDAQISIDEFLSANNDVSYLQIDENKFMTLVFDYKFGQITAIDFFDGKYNGVLDKISYSLATQKFNLDITKPASYDEFYVSNPKVGISVVNYWNIPVQIKFNQFNYYKEETSAPSPVTGTFVSNWHTINGPATAGSSAITELSMDTSNSNIDEIVSALPHHFTISATAETTPGQDYTVASNTIDSINLKIEIPLDFRIKNLSRTDTIDFNPGDKLGQDTSKFESLRLNLVFDNGFPIDMDAQLYFTDANYKKIDSISTEELHIASGTVANGHITGSTKTFKIYSLEGTTKQNFLKSSYLMVSYRFNTANIESKQTVKIYSDYKIGFKAGVLAKFKL
jgi:hypothetical protein